MRRQRREDGQVLILVAFALPLFFALLLLGVDGSNLMVQRRAMQGAADAAALAASQSLNPVDGTCTSAYPAAPSPSCLASVDKYSADNGGESSLVPCDASHQTNCYAAPYIDKNGVSHPQEIEVTLTKNVSTFFGGVVSSLFRSTGFSNVDVSARAVGAFGHGPPPPYTFVSLNSEASCNHHTLVIRLGGQLTVTKGVSVNSCSDDDGFDLFGPGGNISAPEIRTHGGWETHDKDTVTIPIGGSTCSLGPKVFAPATAPHCPITGQPILADPFAGKIPLPSLGSPQCTTPIFGSPVSYTPTKEKLVGNITASATTITSLGTLIQTGDYIRIDTETMLVTAGGGTTSLTVLRGQRGTTAAAHTNGKEIKKIPVTFGGTAATPLPCEVPSGPLTLDPGTYYGGICIGAAAGSDCLGANCTPAPAYTFAEYNLRQTLNAAITDSQTSFVSKGGDAIDIGDVIKIDGEWMSVTDVDVTTPGSGKNTITVTRGYFGTIPASHAGGAHILEGTETPVADVTLRAGTYVMAGGGFRVCGASKLTAPDVLIYNTQNPSSHAFNTRGAIDQVMLNTNGTVLLGAQEDGLYEGLTVFQDPTLEVAKNRFNSNDTCDNKSAGADNPPSPGDVTEWDVALTSMAAGVNGALGSISGTIYAPAPRALFADSVSGTANLAVITGCIFIDGGTSTFDFQPSELYGIGTALGE